MASTRTEASAAASETAEARLTKWSMSSDCLCSMSISKSEEQTRVFFKRAETMELREKSKDSGLGFRLRIRGLEYFCKLESFSESERP